MGSGWGPGRGADVFSRRLPQTGMGGERKREGEGGQQGHQDCKKSPPGWLGREWQCREKVGGVWGGGVGVCGVWEGGRDGRTLSVRTTDGRRVRCSPAQTTRADITSGGDWVTKTKYSGRADDEVDGDDDDGGGEDGGGCLVDWGRRCSCRPHTSHNHTPRSIIDFIVKIFSRYELYIELSTQKSG